MAGNSLSGWGEELVLVLVAMGVALVEAGQPYVPSVNACAE